MYGRRTAAPENPEWISTADGIHLTRAGTVGYAAFVASELGYDVTEYLEQAEEYLAIVLPDEPAITVEPGLSVTEPPAGTEPPAAETEVPAETEPPAVEQGAQTTEEEA